MCTQINRKTLEWPMQYFNIGTQAKTQWSELYPDLNCWQEQTDWKLISILKQMLFQTSAVMDEKCKQLHYFTILNTSWDKTETEWDHYIAPHLHSSISIVQYSPISTGNTLENLSEKRNPSSAANKTFWMAWSQNQHAANFAVWQQIQTRNVITYI